MSQWETIFKGNKQCGLSIQVATKAGLTVLKFLHIFFFSLLYFVQVMVESLEEVAYNLRRDCAERDRLLRKKNEEIARLKARIQELENAGLPLETLE